MPVTFKRTKKISLLVKTDPDDLILCTECGGLQAMAQTSIQLDCETCDGTGYENLYTEYQVDAAVLPGVVQRWNYIQGAMDFLGECSIKLDYSYKSVLENTSHILMDGTKWKFAFLQEPGEAMGQRRLVVALTRK